MALQKHGRQDRADVLYMKKSWKRVKKMFAYLSSNHSISCYLLRRYRGGRSFFGKYFMKSVTFYLIVFSS
ncbi:hypothetical protein AOQ84DRAFT_74591 [Glonium stellatum]|uniref:Uncharacterized protein n=1 Tax=Glonium stellatum TaxID=574774 RepID=A0A8E2EX66_9PEZI|nr:hypothetical protein AOQ84DRAFT_74591 [Glonium stellatum]